jgi:hypothetical protein
MMQFFALRSDRPISLEFQDKYVHKLDIECHKCNKVTYQLHAPFLETESDQVQAQGEWLNDYLPTACPNHPDYLLTPDRARG